MKISKSISFAALMLFGLTAFAQPDKKAVIEVIIPSETPILFSLAKEIVIPNTRKGTAPDKVGDKAEVIVQDDVLINGIVAIKKGTHANAVIRELVPLLYNYKASRSPNNEGQITVDIFDVPAIDGTVIKIRDCYYQIYATTLPVGSIKVGKVQVAVKVAIH